MQSNCQVFKYKSHINTYLSSTFLEFYLLHIKLTASLIKYDLFPSS